MACPAAAFIATLRLTAGASISILVSWDLGLRFRFLFEDATELLGDPLGFVGVYGKEIFQMKINVWRMNEYTFLPC